MDSVLVLKLGSMEWVSLFATASKSLLGLAFVLMLLKEASSFMTSKKADFFTPMAKLALAAAFLNVLPQMVESIFQTTLSMGQTISAGSWDAGWNAAQENITESARVELSSVFIMTPTMLMSAVTFFMGLAMQVVSAIISVLWQVVITCLILAGYLVLPLALIPGAGLTVRSWVKSIIEVSLWPLIFASVQRVAVSCFEGALQRVAAAPSLWSSEGAMAVAENQALIVQMWAMQLIFIFGTILTPLLAMFAVRGTPVGVAIGSALAAGMQMVGGVASLAGGTAMGASLASGAAGSWQQGAATMASGGAGAPPGAMSIVQGASNSSGAGGSVSPPQNEDKRSAGDAVRPN